MTEINKIVNTILQRFGVMRRRNKILPEGEIRKAYGDELVFKHFGVGYFSEGSLSGRLLAWTSEIEAIERIIGKYVAPLNELRHEDC